MQLKLTVCEAGEATVIRVVGGAIGDPSEVDLWQLLHETRQPQIIVNLDHVALINSIDLGALIKAQRRATLHGSRLKLCCVSPTVSRLLSNLRVEKLFDVHDSEESALASLLADPPAPLSEKRAS